jgi:hypothetical protein
MNDAPVSGPIDYLLVEFPGDTISGDSAAALLQLVDLGIVDLLDLVVINKSQDAVASAVALTGGDDAFGGFGAFAGAQSGLLDDDDLQEAAKALDPGTTGVLFVYENKWARGFVAAATEAGGTAVASARIPAEAVMAALDATEPQS